MRLFGFEITRAKAAPPAALTSVASSGFWQVIFDTHPGAWQQHYSALDRDTLLAYHAVYACTTLVANDFGKLAQCLVERDPRTGIWSETASPAFSPLLRRPNPYQNHVQFKEWWCTSKLLAGNAYALKVRDGAGRIVGLYILDPVKVKPLVTPDAEVYYELANDPLAALGVQVLVPATEIIHDRMNCLWHPLIGVSPIFACANAATAGLRIGQSSAKFFANNCNPGGVLTAPGPIAKDTADRLKEFWQENFTGDNAGKVAVLGDGLKFEPMRMSAADAQLIEQLKWSAEIVCACFHVPPFKIGAGTMPTYQNGELYNAIYYSDCLQSLIEQYEACLDEALGFETLTGGKQYGIELDVAGLLRMDRASQIKMLTEGAGGAVLTPDEARAELNRPPLPGGDTLYRQQQEYSLAALAERDANAPFAKPAPAPALPPPAEDEPDEPDETEKFLEAFAHA